MGMGTKYELFGTSRRGRNFPNNGRSRYGVPLNQMMGGILLLGLKP